MSNKQKVKDIVAKVREKVKGKETSVAGFVALLAGAIYTNPELISFLPEQVAEVLKGISGLITVATGGVFVHFVKNKNVTGGSLPATKEAEKRVKEND